MYELLQQIAQANNWVFYYGRKDHQNLQDIEDVDKYYLFVDPIEIDQNFNELNVVESSIESGRFLLLYSSELDEDYMDRYTTTIKPMITTQLNTLNDAMGCSEITINTWKVTEIINLFDAGFDGILVNFSITDE